MADIKRQTQSKFTEIISTNKRFQGSPQIVNYLVLSWREINAQKYIEVMAAIHIGHSENYPQKGFRPTLCIVTYCLCLF